MIFLFFFLNSEDYGSLNLILKNFKSATHENKYTYFLVKLTQEKPRRENLYEINFYFQGKIQIKHNNIYLLLEIHVNLALTNCCTDASISMLYGLTCAIIRPVVRPRFLCCFFALKKHVPLSRNLCCMNNIKCCTFTSKIVLYRTIPIVVQITLKTLLYRTVRYSLKIRACCK